MTVLSALADVAAFSHVTSVQKKSSKTAAKPSTQQATNVPAALLRELRTSLAEAAPVKSVRSPRSGVVRIALDRSLVKETEYRTVLVVSCGEILKAKANRTVTTIEVVNGDERQGYVYRPASRCADLVAVDEERLRLEVLPGTTVFRARR